MTVGEPGVHGDAHAGTQGIGVSTPPALAVAEATVGLAILLHIPNVIGSFGISIIVATGKLLPMTVLCDVTISDAGVAPKEH